MSNANLTPAEIALAEVYGAIIEDETNGHTAADEAWLAGYEAAFAGEDAVMKSGQGRTPAMIFGFAQGLEAGSADRRAEDSYYDARFARLVADGDYA